MSYTSSWHALKERLSLSGSERHPDAGALPQLVSHALGIGRLAEFARNPTETLLRAASARPGEIVTLDFGVRKVLLVTHPEHVQHVLATNWQNYSKGDMLWKPLRRLLGGGLLTTEDEPWAAGRKLVQPLFAPKNLDTLFGSMAGAIERYMDSARLEALGTGASLDTEMKRLTQQVMLATLMHSRITREDTDSVAQALDDALRAVNIRTSFFFLPERFPLPGELDLRRAIKTIDAVIFKLIEQRRQERSPEQIDLLSLFIERNRSFSAGTVSDKHLRDHIVTFYLAGYETSAVSLTWTWYLLADHPACFERLQGELDSTLGGRPPTAADLPNLRYMRMVIQESLRFYPPAWFFPRFALRDDTIDGFRVDAGSTLFISPYVTQRLPTVWSSPEVFDPERFSPERSAQRHRFAYLPFGAGPRQCIGMSFAMMEMQLVIAMLASRLRPVRTAGPPAKPRSVLTLKPTRGVPVQLVAR